MWYRDKLLLYVTSLEVKLSYGDANWITMILTDDQLYSVLSYFCLACTQ